MELTDQARLLHQPWKVTNLGSLNISFFAEEKLRFFTIDDIQIRRVALIAILSSDFELVGIQINFPDVPGNQMPWPQKSISVLLITPTSTTSTTSGHATPSYLDSLMTLYLNTA